MKVCGIRYRSATIVDDMIGQEETQRDVLATFRCVLWNNDKPRPGLADFGENRGRIRRRSSCNLLARQPKFPDKRHTADNCLILPPLVRTCIGQPNAPARDVVKKFVSTQKWP